MVAQLLRAAAFQPDLTAQVKKHILPIGILALCVTRLWVMPLWSSFWTDEIGTAFLVRYGASHPSFDAVPQFPMSIYYWLPRAADAMFGFSEAAYRLPSLLVALGSLYFVWLLAVRLIHPQAAWLAIFSAIALPGFSFQAADARPYALGSLVALASLYFLIRWLDTSQHRDALLFVVLAALLWRVHLLFWPLYIVFALYAGIRLMLRETRVNWRKTALCFVLLGGALVPVLSDVMTVLPRAKAHSIVPPPNTLEFVMLSGSWLVLVCGLAIFVYGAARSEAPDIKLSLTSWLLIIAFWLLHPTVLALYSHITGISVFVGRYMSVSLAGAGFAIAAVATVFLRSDSLKAVACMVGFAALLTFGQWGAFWPQHHEEDLRAAAAAIRQFGGDSVPVICPSPFFEAQPPVWRPNYPIPSFLYSHLSIYEVPGKFYPFPIEAVPEVEKHAAELSENVLARSGRFFIFGYSKRVEFWRDWFTSRPELANWTYRTLGPFGIDEVGMFEAPMQQIGDRQ